MCISTEPLVVSTVAMTSFQHRNYRGKATTEIYRTRQLLILLGSVLCLCWTLLASAQEEDPTAIEPRQPWQEKQAELDEIWTSLGLSEDQEREISVITRRGFIEQATVYREHGLALGQLVQSDSQERRSIRELRRLRRNAQKAREAAGPIVAQQVDDILALLTEEQLHSATKLEATLTELFTFASRRQPVRDYIAGVSKQLGPPIVFPTSVSDGERATFGRRGGLLLLTLLGVLLGAEMLWSYFGKKKAYNVKETFANIGIAVGTQLLRPVSTVWRLWVFGFFGLFFFAGNGNDLPWTFERSGWMFLITFIAADFAYYWYHRLSHEVTCLWTMHHTHHSSPYMNLTTAVRLNWVANFVSPFFFLPLIVIGFPGDFVALSLALGLFYQLFLHTEAIPRLGWFEGKLLNTPSAHRVHHGSNTQYIDKNYGGALIIWDRLFKSYEPEVEKVEYGVTTGKVGYNPFVIQLKPLFSYISRNFKRERIVDNERKATA
ncbi:MAG: hypothetical protein F4227_06140 [Gammaproteobacteria bacterium]|nr:hypothetical protein [Gammaproteobacteria bacterium]MYF02544.1 hypothetical protein [Gammaproteobacteria bacterium]MYI76276.1 hypothetical protein [Gammaproteobacteria bacterium]